MAEGDVLFYNAFRFGSWRGVYDLAAAGHTLRVILVSGYTPDLVNDAVYADVSALEYGTGLGYTVGGEALSGQSLLQDDVNERALFDSLDIEWVDLGPLSPATPSHAILYDDTPTSPADPLILCWELGSTATTGGTYRLQPGAPGIATMT